MPMVDDTLELVRKAAADMGATKLAAAAGVTDDFVRRLCAGEVQVVTKLQKLEGVAQKHADEQRLRWTEAGG